MRAHLTPVVWIDRDDRHTLLLHVGRDTIGRASRIGRKAHHGNHTAVLQDLIDRFWARRFHLNGYLSPSENRRSPLLVPDAPDFFESLHPATIVLVKLIADRILLIEILVVFFCRKEF
jgi:hypothetical protein